MNTAGKIGIIVFVLVIGLFLYFGCGNPYIMPQTSKAISEEKQIKLLEQQNELLKQQNAQLKRIADGIESKTR